MVAAVEESESQAEAKRAELVPPLYFKAESQTNRSQSFLLVPTANKKSGAGYASSRALAMRG